MEGINKKVGDLIFEMILRMIISSQQEVLEKL